VHIFAYLLNALTKSDIFGMFNQQFMSNTALHDIYSYSLEGATRMKQLAPCFLTGSFIQRPYFIFKLSWLKINVVWFLFIQEQICILMLLKYRL